MLEESLESRAQIWSSDIEAINLVETPLDGPEFFRSLDNGGRVGIRSKEVEGKRIPRSEKWFPD
jgi:hypothetical protein